MPNLYYFGGFLVRPERLELPTYWFEASRSIQLSYGRAIRDSSKPYSSATTGLRGLPKPWPRGRRTSSPGLNQRGGLRAKPTPAGVPVEMTSPGSSVKTLDR